MSISYVDLNRTYDQPVLSLCKPNLERTKIGNLKDVYNVQLTINQGALNELSFTMPLYVERQAKQVRNPLIDLFNGMYFVRCEMNNRTEYFVYTKGNRSISDSGKEYNYNLYSIGHLLSKKLVPIYEETSKSLSWFVMDLLSETDWTIGFVDVEFDLLKRSYEATDATVLQTMFELAEKFGALIEWDTINQKINFLNPEDDGLNKGMKIKEGVTLESLNAEINYDEIVTRLYIYGQDGLEIRRLSPTGSNYIESFDWYMYPFECDENYNVIKSSKYMSDELCVAIRKYEKKVADADPRFKVLTMHKTNLQDYNQQLEQEMSVLTARRNDLLNRRDVINATYMELAPLRADWQQIINQINGVDGEITTLQTEINNVQNAINILDGDIGTLRESLAVENNYTPRQLLEMNKFINSKKYYNDSITEEEDLLQEGIKAFKKYNVPPVIINVSLANFLNDVTFEKIRNRIAIGDKVTVKLDDMDIHLLLKIHKITYNCESNDISLEVTNLLDLKDDWDLFLNKIYTAGNTSTTVDLNKHMWAIGETANDRVTQLINSAFDTGKNILLGGYENTVTITPRGLYSKDLHDPNTFMVINMAQLVITKDGGNSVEVAINKDGVFANKLHGRLLLSNKLWVEDDQGVVEIKSGLLTVYDQSNNPRVYLGRYPTFENPNQFKYGLRVIDGAFDIRTSNSTNKGIVITGDGISAFNNNGVRTFNVDASTGKVSIVGSLDIRTSADSNKGVVIDGDGIKIYNASGTIMFSANAQGDVFYKGRLDGATGTVRDLGGTLNNMSGNVSNLTGSISAMDGTFQGALVAATGTFDGLVTGSLSVDTVDAIRLDVDQLIANNAQINSLSAISADLGTVTAGHLTGVSIDTTEDMTVGNNLYIGRHFAQQDKAIIFGGGLGGARIDYTSDSLYYSAMNGHHFSGGAVVIDTVLDLTNATVIGL